MSEIGGGPRQWAFYLALRCDEHGVGELGRNADRRPPVTLTIARLSKSINMLSVKEFVDARLYPDEPTLIQDALRHLVRARPELGIDLAVHKYRAARRNRCP